MTKGSLDVSVYSAPRAPAAGMPPAQGRPSSRSRSRLGVSIGAAFAAILLHVVLMTSILWGAGGRSERRPERLPPGASTQSSHERDLALQWVVLDTALSADDAEQQTTGAPAPFPLTLTPIPVDLQPTEVGAGEEDRADKAASSTVAGDAAMRSALYGRYLGQINARIDRAWRRPSGEVGAMPFSCVVSIDQDDAGNVREVTLVQCNGDASWQLSIVQAIETASPLPAPPDPAVFSRIVRMRFQSTVAEAPSPAGTKSVSGASSH